MKTGAFSRYIDGRLDLRVDDAKRGAEMDPKYDGIAPEDVPSGGDPLPDSHAARIFQARSVE